MRTARPRSASAAGFTLIELMVVVLIISVVAVLAVPSLSSAGYDRRVFTDAASVGELVREARTRAVGRGAAELIAMTTAAATNSASFTLYESVTPATATTGSTAPNTPMSSCNLPTVWPGSGSGTVTANLVDAFVFSATPTSGSGQTLEGQGNIIARITDPAGNIIADGTTVYLCFTPNGRVVYEEGASTAYLFNPMPVATGAPNAFVVELTRNSFPTTVYPNDTGTTDLIRAVLISPSGTTRITSQ
jgi:prepilin-type N-terminal cleavage/methylation domain-containing protein